ncbi:hypothetical protein AB0J72_57460 [Dactylosporangium sp. NPDC049742]
MAGTRLTDVNATLLRVLLDQLRVARERALLRIVENEERPITD